MQVLIAILDPTHIDTAVFYGNLVAQLTDQPLTLLSVIKHETDRSKIDQTLNQARDLLFPTISEVQTKIRRGHIANEIIHEASEGDYNMLILDDQKGDHHSAPGRVEPTVITIVERAPCSVLLIKGEAKPIRRILLCDSGAETPSYLAQFTTRLVDLIEGEEQITVLHVMSQMSAGPGVEGKQLRASVDDLLHEETPEGNILDQDLQILEIARANSHPKVRHGFVVDEILDEAQSGNYDLVVIGAHRSEGWLGILLDDLAHQIIDKIDRPILVVR